MNKRRRLSFPPPPSLFSFFSPRSSLAALCVFAYSLAITSRNEQTPQPNACTTTQSKVELIKPIARLHHYQDSSYRDGGFSAVSSKLRLNRTISITTIHQMVNHFVVCQSFDGKLYVFPIESAFRYSHQLNRNESSNCLSGDIYKVCQYLYVDHHSCGVTSHFSDFVMPVSITCDSIIVNIPFIIKTAKRYFVYFITSELMFF